MEVISRRFEEVDTFEIANERTDGYNSSSLDFDYAKQPRSVCKFSDEKHTVPGHREMNVLSILSAVSYYGDSDIDIIDVGGADGLHYGLFRKYYYGKSNISWNVVETTVKADYGRKFIVDPELSFHTNVADCQVSHCNILNVSGALQYLPDHEEFLNNKLVRSADFIVFNAVHHYNGDGLKPFVQITEFDLGVAPYPGRLIGTKWFTETMEKTHALEVAWPLADEGWVTDRGTRIRSWGSFYIRKGLRLSR